MTDKEIIEDLKNYIRRGYSSTPAELWLEYILELQNKNQRLEAFNRLQKDGRIIYENRCEELQAEIERLLIVQGELQDLNVEYYNDAKDLRRELDRVRAWAKINDEYLHIRIKDQSRKETVEKFASLLTDGRQTLDICEKDTGKVCDKAYIIPQSFIDEICKEIMEGKYGTND